MDERRLQSTEVTLLELMDRMLNKGVVVSGDLTISVAGVDLIFLGLKVMLTSVERARAMQLGLDLPALLEGGVDG